jgi:hypothetical protein
MQENPLPRWEEIPDVPGDQGRSYWCEYFVTFAKNIIGFCFVDVIILPK